MTPAEVPTGAGTGAAPQTGTDTGAEDTLDLPLPEELLGLLGGGEETGPAATARVQAPAPDAPVSSVRSASSVPSAPGGGADPAGVPGTAEGRAVSSRLLDRPAEWGPVTTPAGVFQLVPVRLERDLALISRWMNDPAVAAFWELAGTEAVTADHLRPQLDGDGRSLPCLGVLAGIPMSYWEIYRADLDPLARHYPARPHDTGIHLLIGGVDHRGRGLGTTLLRAVSDLVLDNRPLCARVVAEPDLRNTPSVSAFMSAGFRFFAEIELPDKRAALMVRDRSHRDQL
ncbi:GNAT family N-acetyltransferase [Streptomyces sp. NPDC056061]|uniref:GNAT family N-acetyltransferase n=1 Tax=Streptomyces sp. NPDC056061 TaxID=3345700 RepID=UPI0035D5B0D6